MLTKLIKRLEIIKNLLLIDDTEEILEQAEKLKTISSNNQSVLEIIESLQANDFTKAIELIESFLKQNNQVQVYEDPEVKVMSLEKDKLKHKLFTLEQEKVEIEKTIFEFEVRWKNELWELTLNILELEQEQKAKEFKQAEHSKQKENIKEKEELYEEAKKQYENFKKNYDEIKDEQINTLNEEEKKEIKNTFKKSAQKCHPDMVKEEHKEKAKEIFQRLNKAYQENDIEEVKKIAKEIELWNIFNEKPLTNCKDEKKLKEELKKEIEYLKNKIQSLQKILDSFKNSDTYKMIVWITDIDSFFVEKKKKLTEKYEKLVNTIT